MSLTALPELLLAWVKSQGAALLQGNKAEQSTPFKVGAQYEGKVLDQLPTGRHLVQVAGQKLDMGLPRNTQTGDTVRLTFLNAGARPTFLLNNQGPATPVQQVQISNTAQQVSALMRVVPPAARTPVQATAQVAVQAAAGSGAVTAPSATAAAPAPSATVAAAAAQTAALPGGGPARQIPAGQPQAALASLPKTAAPLPASSPAAAPAAGQAVGPQRPMPAGQAMPSSPVAMNQAPAALAPRPIVANVVMLQGYSAATPANVANPAPVASANTALLGQAVDSLRASVPASTTLRPTVIADPASPSPNLLPARLAQTLKESGLFYESHLARWTKGTYPLESVLNEPQARLGRLSPVMQGMAELAGMPEEAARLAGRQLHMLEGGAFLWQGYAWPGQWMDWLVEERHDSQGDGHEGEEASPWDTELRLTLPRMGAVNAQLSLRGMDVTLRLQADEADTVLKLGDALPDLQRGLESSGLRPVSLTVTEGAG